MTGEAITAAAAGTWTLGDLTVNRIGFGAMRLTSNADGTPGDRVRAVAVLRRALELGVNRGRSDNSKKPGGVIDAMESVGGLSGRSPSEAHQQGERALPAAV